MNGLFDKLTNFKIKHRENPDPIEIANMDLFFYANGRRYDDVIHIVHDKVSNKVGIWLTNDDEDT